MQFGTVLRNKKLECDGNYLIERRNYNAYKWIDAVQKHGIWIDSSGHDIFDGEL